MAFVPFKEIPTHNLRRSVIGNSQTAFAVGMAIQPGATGHNKFVVESGTSNPVLGVVLGIEGNGGQVLEKTSLTTASNNETVILIKAVWVPSNLPIDYVADMSAALGTTTDSGGMCWFNQASGSLTLDETSVALFGGTQGQFWSYGQMTDPIVQSKQVVGHWSKTL